IGPRSEIEIFALLAAGFHSDRIRALDLFSCSPYVEVGDMHAMPYGDNSFDVVFLGWVLAYSQDPARAAREITRVCRNGAIVIASADYNDGSNVSPRFKNQGKHITSVDQILGYFDRCVGHVYFTQNPKPPETFMVITAFEIEK